jgi:hypothetical protein
VRAEFIGKTSMGFITGHIYTIETACKMVKRCKTSRADPVPCLCVYMIKTLRRGVRIAVWKRF